MKIVGQKVAGGGVGGDDVNPWLMPRWVTGIPARVGMAMAEETPGTISKRAPGLLEGQGFLTAPSEDEGIAALETDDSHSFLCKRNEEHVNLSSWCALWRPFRLPMGYFSAWNEASKRAGSRSSS